MNTYTKHRLTDSQLRRLAALCNPEGGGAKGGVSFAALERKGLARTLYKDREFGPPGRTWTRSIYVGREPTDEGRQALADARAEGW